MPAIVGMTVTSLYNIIDSIFIGHGVGALAISGLAITFPLMNLLVAFCTLVGVGGATIASIRLGQKDKAGAEDIVGNVTILSIISALFYGGITLIFLDPVLFYFGASHDTLPYARDFMQIILLGTPITYVMIGLNNVMRATGYPKKAMLSSILTVGCNIALAPVFIFVFDWGMRGAAFATICSQTIGLVWVLSHFFNRNTYIRFRKASMRLKTRIVRTIFSIGMSPFFMNVCACCVVIFINHRLLTYGTDMSVGAFGILNRVQMLFVMVVMGLAQGIQPIAGYNYGSGQWNRVKQTIRKGIIVASSITTLGCLCCVFVPQMFVGMFTDNPELSKQSVTALRFGMAMFPFVGSQIIICQFFQSIGKAGIAIFLSLSRQLVFLLPGLALLPLWMDVDGIWMSMPISDLLAAITATAMYAWQMRRFNKNTTGTLA